MSKSLLTDILRAIRRSFSRFLSIVIIVALGTGIFVGIKSAAPSMSETADEYFADNQLMDIRVQSSIGLTSADVDAISKIDGVSGVMGEKFVDALVLVNGKPEIDIDGSQISTRAYGINLKKLQDKQKVVSFSGEEQDVIAAVRGVNSVCFSENLAERLSSLLSSPHASSAPTATAAPDKTRASYIPVTWSKWRCVASINICLPALSLINSRTLSVTLKTSMSTAASTSDTI